MQSEAEQIDEHEKANHLEAGDLSTPLASDEVPTQEMRAENTENLLSGVKLVTVVTALMLTILCVALDNTSQ